MLFRTSDPQKSLLHIVDTVCKNHNEDRPGWKHPWVCITERGELGNRAIWIWVNDVLLDSSNEALMLDCCIISVERMVDAASARLGAAIDEDNDEEGGPGIYFVEVCGRGRGGFLLFTRVYRFRRNRLEGVKGTWLYNGHATLDVAHCSSLLL